MSTHRTADDVKSYRASFLLDRAAYMVSAALADNGGTFTPETGKRAELTTGFMVGGARQEYVYHIDRADRGVQINAVRTLIRTAEAMRGSSVGIYVGAWHNVENDTMVWELSEHEPYRASAVANGTMRNEYSIWDIAAGAEIVL